MTLMVSNATGSAAIGPVDYADTDVRRRRGWIFDFDISSNAAAQQILQDPEAKFSLQHAQYGTVLAETDYYFVSNQQGIYAEQNGPGDSFLNQGTSEPATVSVYHRGRELGPAECPPITVWQYRSVPIQSPGNVEAIATNFKPGQPLQVDTSQPGNFLFTFSIDDAANPVLTGFPPTELQHLHDAALHHERAVDQPAHPAQRRGLQQVLRRPERHGTGGQRSTHLRRGLPEGAAHLLPAVPGHEFVFPLNSEAEVAENASGHPRRDRSDDAVDVERVHAAHPRHVRQPPHAPPGLVPEGPRRMTTPGTRHFPDTSPLHPGAQGDPPDVHEIDSDSEESESDAEPAGGCLLRKPSWRMRATT